MLARFMNGAFIARYKPDERRVPPLVTDEDGWIGLGLFDCYGRPRLAIYFMMGNPGGPPFEDTLPGVLDFIDPSLKADDEKIFKQFIWFVKTIGLDQFSDRNHGSMLMSGVPHLREDRVSLESWMVPKLLPSDQLHLERSPGPLTAAEAMRFGDVLAYVQSILVNGTSIESLKGTGISDLPPIQTSIRGTSSIPPTDIVVVCQPKVTADYSVLWYVSFHPGRNYEFPREILTAGPFTDLYEGLVRVLATRAGVVEEGRDEVLARYCYAPGYFLVSPDSVELYELLDEPSPLFWRWDDFLVWAQETGLEVIT